MNYRNSRLSLLLAMMRVVPTEITHSYSDTSRSRFYSYNRRVSKISFRWGTTRRRRRMGVDRIFFSISNMGMWTNPLGTLSSLPLTFPLLYFPAFPSLSSSHPLIPTLPLPSPRNKPLSMELEGLGERCKLPQRGLRLRPSRNWIWCI